MLKETEETIVFFVTFLSLVAFQLGGRPLGLEPSGYVYGRTVRQASIFAKKYSTLVRYDFFVMVRWYGTLQKLN